MPHPIEYETPLKDNLFMNIDRYFNSLCTREDCEGCLIHRDCIELWDQFSRLASERKIKQGDFDWAQKKIDRLLKPKA